MRIVYALQTPAVGSPAYSFTSFILDLVVALLTLILFSFLAQFLRRLIKRVASRTSKNTNLPILLGNLVYIILMVVALVIVISVFTGSGLETIITSVGFLGAALGLSLQDVIRNFVAGVCILLEQPFSVGERVFVRDTEGTVENIKLRATRIRTDAGVGVIVPNLIMFSEVVVNRTDLHQQRYNTLWLTLPLETLSYEVASQKIKEIMTEQALEETAGKPGYFLNIESIGATEAKLRLDFWSGINSKPLNDMVITLNKALPEACISSTKPA